MRQQRPEQGRVDALASVLGKESGVDHQVSCGRLLLAEVPAGQLNPALEEDHDRIPQAPHPTEPIPAVAERWPERWRQYFNRNQKAASFGSRPISTYPSHSRRLRLVSTSMRHAAASLLAGTACYCSHPAVRSPFARPEADSCLTCSRPSNSNTWPFLTRRSMADSACSRAVLGIRLYPSKAATVWRTT